MIKLIIADDEQLVRKGLVLTTDWNRYGCEVVGEASNGLEGYELIKKTKPSLVITDVRMPGLDGIRMIEQLKRDGIKSEFIVISGYSEFEYAKQALKLGVTDFLVKPIEDTELSEALTKACKIISEKERIGKLESQIENADRMFLLFKEYTGGTGEGSHYVSRAIKYITANYKNDISIKTAADSLFISESYLSRLFKSEVGQTFGDYLTYYRIKMACKLLESPNVKIYSVANLIGYRDQRYFSVIFKKLVGLTPKEFRNIRINEKETDK